MSRWGVGPRLTFIALGLFAVAVALHRWRPLRLDGGVVPYGLLAAGGVLLIVVGNVFYVAAAVGIMRAYNHDTLCTGGMSRLCRHPIYAAWIVFITPGIALLFNSWIVLAVPVFVYGLARVLVRREEAYLEQRFGDAYRAYKRRTPAFFPLGWRPS